VKAVILVGGEGTRLRPLTCNIPKPMLPMMNRPFIEHVIKHLAKHGVDEVILSAGYKPQAFDSHLGDGHEFGVKITYVVEKRPLGTCGAVKNVAELLNDSFVVCNGDILTDLNISHMLEFHRKKQSSVTIALTSVEDPTQYGLVPIDDKGRVTEFLEKPSWDEVTTDLINAGTYILEPEVLNGVSQGVHCSFERDLFPELLGAEKPVFGMPTGAYWIDIGSPSKYLRAHKDILNGKVGIDVAGDEIKKGVWACDGADISDKAMVFGPTLIGAGVSVAADADIFGQTVIGDNCVIAGGARLEGCVLYEGVSVGEGAVVKDSILGKGVTVGAKVRVEEEAILGDNTVVDEENVLKKGVKIWPDTKVGRGMIRF